MAKMDDDDLLHFYMIFSQLKWLTNEMGKLLKYHAKLQWIKIAKWIFMEKVTGREWKSETRKNKLVICHSHREEKKMALNKWPKIDFRKDSIAKQSCHTEVYPWVTKWWHCQSTDSATPALLILVIIRVQNSILEFRFSSWSFWKYLCYFWLASSSLIDSSKMAPPS